MSASPSIPREIGRYQVERVLGRGAMGTVYLATDPHIQRRVALKTIRADLVSASGALDGLGASAERDGISGSEWSARFLNEARAAGRLVHPNIVAVFDYGEIDGVAYIALEYVDGGSLADRLAGHIWPSDDPEHGGQRGTAREPRSSHEASLRTAPHGGVVGRGGAMPLRDALLWLAQLLDALAYAHEQGVIHRDIKPANLLIGARVECKIADFGIAQVDTGRLTAVGMMIGTPSYMSPEQYVGREVDARSDLFSAGVVLYEMVTGRCPFVGNAAAIMHQVLETMPPAPSSIVSGLPIALDAMLARALAKRPEDRYASANAWQAEILDLIDAVSNRRDDDRTVVAPLGRRAVHSAHGAHGAHGANTANTAHGGYAAHGGHTTHAATGATRAPSVTEVSEAQMRFPKEMLADVERRLASHVGPVASLLVKRAAVRSTDARMLAAQLARHAPDDAARRAIDEALAGYERSDRQGRDGQPSNARPSDLPRSARESAGAGSDGPYAATGHAARGHPAAVVGVVDNALIEAAARCLATHMGPVATLIAQRASRGADVETFFRKLADALPASVDRVTFIERLRGLLR